MISVLGAFVFNEDMSKEPSIRFIDSVWWVQTNLPCLVLFFCSIFLQRSVSLFCLCFGVFCCVCYLCSCSCLSSMDGCAQLSANDSSTILVKPMLRFLGESFSLAASTWLFSFFVSVPLLFFLHFMIWFRLLWFGLLLFFFLLFVVVLSNICAKIVMKMSFSSEAYVSGRNVKLLGWLLGCRWNDESFFDPVSRSRRYDYTISACGSVITLC